MIKEHFVIRYSIQWFGFAFVVVFALLPAVVSADGGQTIAGATCAFPGEDPPPLDQSDCNGNGVRDSCDIDPSDPDGDGVVYLDLNGNHRPDECDLEGRLVGLRIDIDLHTGHASRYPELPGLPADKVPDWIDFAPDGTLYGLKGRSLYTIDTDNWTTSDVVEVQDDIESPTFSQSGTLYAMRRIVPNPGEIELDTEIVTVDLTTGAVSLIGVTGYTYGDFRINRPGLRAIAFHADSDLWAVHDGLEADPYQYATLLRLDPLTGLATEIGDLQEDEWGSSYRNLAFDGDTLYAYRVTDDGDIGMRQFTELEVLSMSDGQSSGRIKLPIDVTSYNQHDDLTFSPDGTLWGVERDLMIISPQSGEARYIRARPESSGLALSPHGELYATGSQTSKVDYNSGAVTLQHLALPAYDEVIVRHLTFCPDGVVYAEWYEVNETSWLVVLDLGAGTFNSFLTTDFSFSRGALACSPDGTLISVEPGTTELGVYDRATGEQTITTPATRPIESIAYTPDGTLYAVDDEQLMTLDFDTGETTVIGPLGMPVGDIAYIPAEYAIRPLPRSAIGPLGACMTGPGAALNPGCAGVDYETDGSIDLKDVARLSNIVELPLP